MTAKELMMDLQVLHCSASLAFPRVPLQNFLPQLLISDLIEPQACLLWPDGFHDALVSTSWTNSLCCCCGKNLKNRVIENRNVSGSPLSKLAPARKSAQIISRQ